MARTNIHFPAVRQNDDDVNSPVEEETRLGSGAARDPLEDLINDLEYQANVRLIRPAGGGLHQDENAGLEDVNPEDGGARELASKLAPNRKPRVRLRRRMRRPKDERWSAPDEQGERHSHNSKHYTDRWAHSHLAKPPTGSGNKWIWGMSTGLLLLASIGVVLVFVGPRNGLLSSRIGDASVEANVDRTKPVDILAEIELVRKSVGSNDAPVKPVEGEFAVATPPRPVQTITVRPKIEVPPIAPAPVGNVVIGSQANTLATAGEETPAADGSGFDLEPSSGAAEKSAIPEGPPVKTERPRVPALPQLVQAEPEMVTRLPTSQTSPSPTPQPSTSLDIQPSTMPTPQPSATLDTQPSTAPTPQPSATLDTQPSIAPTPQTSTLLKTQASTTPTPQLNTSLNTQPSATPLPQPSATLNTRPTTSDEPVSETTAPAKPELSAASTDSLLARGEALLRRGDITSARLVFLRAAAAGDPRAARGVGMTYDPDVYARLPVTGLKPDREQAEIWYSRAGENSKFMTFDEDIVAEPAPVDTEAQERHAACARKYRSYNADTGLYRSFSGVMRRCRLP